MPAGPDAHSADLSLLWAAERARLTSKGLIPGSNKFEVTLVRRMRRLRVRGVSGGR